MASVFSHAIAASAMTAAFYRPSVAKRVWIVGIACSLLPDVDVVGFRFGIHYDDFWGHRGVTHSLAFAALLAAALAAAIRRTPPEISRVSLCVYLFLSTASHGLLDSMTNAGRGVAFFSPFHNQRYFLPWRPIRVSPIGVARFFGARGLAVLKSELLWIWLPSILVILLVTISRRLRTAEPQFCR
jgi:inner membrane protein